MTAAQPNADRSVKIAKRVQNGAIEIVRLVRSYALTHIAEDDAGHSFQQSGVAKMNKHAIPLVGFRADVFKKKNTGAFDLRSIRRAECLREDGDTSPIQLAFRETWSEDPQSVFNAKCPGAIALQGVLPACNVHAVVAREIGGRHRTVEGDEVSLIVQPAMKRSVIAVTNKNFRVGANQRSVKMGQQLRRPPAAAGTQDSVNRRICECGMQILQAIFHRACVIQWPAIECVGAQSRFVTERVQMSDTAMHQVRLRCTRRRKNRK